MVVPAHVVSWTRGVMKLIRCDQGLTEDFLREWLRSNRSLDDLNEAVVADFLLRNCRMIDKDTWERHRRMCIVKMYFGSNIKYANKIKACALACAVGVGFAKRAVQDEKS